jgi:glycosyltransferase involved in cell wall biosynthesis
MLHGKKIVVVLPAYRAAKTLERTHAEIPRDAADEVLLVDDASQDDTVAMARTLGIRTFVHPRNRGYGANQKTCYTEALRAGG